jgi:hypothetical protein
MFWGTVLKAGKGHKFGEHDEESSLIHISNAAISSSSEGRVSVLAKVGSTEYVLANLEKNKVEHTSLDLYFRVE